jgi:GH24 family phage-related lysozyme (muramidase)
MAKLFSKDNAVSAYITNGNKYQSSEMKFQVADETSKKALSSSYIDYQKPITIRVSYDKVSAATISATYGIDPYRLVKANPQINWKVSFNKDNMAILSPATLPKGTKLNIPERYTIKAGSVKNFSDVAKVTGISENYIKDILMGIEGRHGKPDLKAYYDGVGSGKGTLTIGFGHCGRVNGKPLTSKTRITEAQAYELLAQDILDAKINAIDYLGKSNFENAPKSIQTAIIDIAFNKGIYSGFELPNSKTKELKKNLAQKDYVHAAANTVRKTGSKGLKKRNIYRAIMATGNLTKAERARALALIKPEYEATVKLFSGVDKKLLEKAWQNAHRGITSGFFSK